MGYKGGQVIRNFIWKFTDAEDAKKFDRFMLILTTRSTDPETELLKYIKQFNEDNEIPFDIVWQQEAIRRLESDGLSATRGTLKKYRDLGVLVDETGNPFWFTSGFNVSYNYDLLKEFVEERKIAGCRPLVQK